MKRFIANSRSRSRCRCRCLALAVASAAAIPALFVITPAAAQSQEDSSAPNPEMLERLGGQALKQKAAAEKSPAFRTRGLKPVETATPPAPIATETRKVLFSTRGIRGIPEGVEAFDRDSEADLKEVTAPAKNADSDYGDLSVAAGETAYEISYAVDPTSKLSTQAIKFVKGGVDLADEGSRRFLNELAATLKDASLADFKYVIEGHASAESTADFNQDLSQKRANEIFHFLVNRGVPAERLLPVGFGESQARFPDTSPESALAEDRRVLIFKLEN